MRKQPPMPQVGCCICRLHLLLLVVAAQLKCLWCSAAIAPWGPSAGHMGAPDKQETEGLSMNILLEHRVSLPAPTTLDVNLDALSRIHTSHYSMFKFWVKDAALTLVSVFAARWRPTQIVILPYACSIYNNLILIAF